MKLNLAAFILFIFVSMMNELNAQFIENYEWKNRVILIFSPSFEHEKLEKQIKIFDQDRQGMMERKLKVIQITPNKMRIEKNSISTKKNIEKIYQNFKVNTSSFRLILIGLDGGNKISQSSPITLNKLFGTIDRMPMRRSEIKRKTESQKQF